MGIRFSKSIKLGDLLKINISKSGISATLGPKGASVNIGKNGTYLNVSPTIAGISGTGVSYRQKITSGYGSVLKKLTDKDSKPSDNKDDIKETKPEVKEIENKALEENIHIHKYSDDVLSKKEFDKKIDSLESESSKDIYNLLIQGDEETIENFIGAFLNNLDLNYQVKANYELEDHILYVDLDLPEIEEFEKRKASELKEEYGKTVLSLGVYLSANFFNISSYIDEIVISGFTSKRNSDGDLVDEYLYSVKYLRKEFENTKLSELDDVYKFMLKFENRINMSANYAFKAIKPYEMASVTKTNSLIDDAVAGLKELGYKQNDINRILDKLNEFKFDNASDYVKEALKLLASNN